MTKLIQTLRRMVEALTCHHCLYGALALLYTAAQVGLCDKALVAALSPVIYLAMALRP